jgi:hypothetical protein
LRSIRPGGAGSAAATCSVLIRLLLVSDTGYGTNFRVNS